MIAWSTLSPRDANVARDALIAARGAVIDAMADAGGTPELPGLYRANRMLSDEIDRAIDDLKRRNNEYKTLLETLKEDRE